MTDFGYDVISVATATATSVVHNLDIVNDVSGANDASLLGELDLGLGSDELWTYLCSHYRQSVIESLAGNASSSFSNPIHVEGHADLKQQTSDYFRFVVDVYVVAAICVIGFIGNALTVAVLRLDPDKTNSTTWLLQALAAVDTLYLAAVLVIQPLKAVHEATEGGLLPPAVFPSVERHVWPLAAVTQTATVWIVLIVTADRYVAVCLPFQAKWRNINRTRALVVGVCLLSFLYNVPQWFEREVVSELNTCSRQHVNKLRKTHLVDSRAYFIIYKTACHFVFRTVGPLVALSLLNWRLVQSLRAVRRRRQRNASSSAATSVKLRGGNLPQSNLARSGSTSGGHGGSTGGGGRGRENVTMMVVAVICVFIVCELPDVALRVIGTVVNDLAAAGDTQEMSDYTRPAGEDTGFFTDPSAMQALNSVTNALLALNSAANFAIYCLVGKKFRRILRRRIFHCIPKSSKTPAGGSRSNDCGRCCCCCCCCCRSRRDSFNNDAYHTCTRLDGYSMAASRAPVIPDTADEQRGVPIQMAVVAGGGEAVGDVVELTSNDYNENDADGLTMHEGNDPSTHRQMRVSFCPSHLNQADCTEQYSDQSVERCIVVVIETEAQSARAAIENNITASRYGVDCEAPPAPSAPPSGVV